MIHLLFRKAEFKVIAASKNSPGIRLDFFVALQLKQGLGRLFVRFLDHTHPIKLL
jgi:hypothetical protein